MITRDQVISGIDLFFFCQGGDNSNMFIENSASASLLPPPPPLPAKDMLSLLYTTLKPRRNDYTSHLSFTTLTLRNTHLSIETIESFRHHGPSQLTWLRI